MSVLLSAPTLSQAAYDCIADIVYARSRIRLGKDKQALVSGRLAKRLRQLGLETFEEYCDRLESGDDPEEISMLVDFISTNHTNFFREPAHLDFLRDQIIPSLMPTLIRSHQPLRVWSAACSTGEEPYSLAIVLAEHIRSHGAASWQISASDISTRVLASARSGIYAEERVQLPKPEWLPRYFQKGVGEHAGKYRVKDCLRSQIQFHHLNLLQAQYPVPAGQHVIFCRNVMIYFDHETQQELVSKLVAQLAPGGHLIVGMSESLLNIRHTLKPVKPSVYQKN